MEVALEYFIVRIRQRRKTKLLPLDDFDGVGTSLIDLAAKALAPAIKGNWKALPGKTVSVQGFKKDSVGFSGILKLGEYGLASEVLDINSGSKAFDKAKHHAEQVPFYFRLHVPKGRAQGMLILQRLANKGITGVVRTTIRDYFAEKTDGYVLDVAPMVPELVFQRYLKEGRPRSISFIKNSIPSDKADKVSGKSEEAKGKVEVKITSPDPAFFQPQNLIKALSKSTSASSVAEIKSVYSFDEFQPDKISMRIDVGGNFRTINLNNHANLRATFDITDKVKPSSSGYPNVKDVERAAQDILMEVSKAAGVPL